MTLFRFDHHRTRKETGGPGSVPVPRFFRFRTLAFVPAVLMLALHAAPVAAIDFSDGALSGRIDTTLSHGLMFRTQGRDARILDANANGDDGNRNHDRGLISSASKITSEVELQSGDFGFFARASAFYDSVNNKKTREHMPLSPGARKLVGRDAELLDFYVTGEFEVGDAIGDVRAGNHVINWGESTFIPNGISIINPFDVSKLRVPGAELREALLPVPAASASFAPLDALSIEAFYQLKWKPVEIDPAGSFFSVTDYVGEGGRKAVLPVPGVPITDKGIDGWARPFVPAMKADLGADFAGRIRFDHQDFGSVPRGGDHEPDDGGQWGMAARYLSEEFNGTEFGFYFVNYHSRLPLVSGRGGDQASVRDANTIVGRMLAPNSNTMQAATQAVTQAVTPAVTQAITQRVSAQIPAGTPNRDQLIQQQVAQLVPAEVAKQVKTQVPQLAGGLALSAALDRYGQSGGYFVEYPEDIQLFGVSFNTLLGTTGWALQGEYSFRRDAPLQIDESALFASALTPLCPQPNAANPLCNFYNPVRARLLKGQVVQGHVRRNVSQLQATATRVFGPVAGSDSLTFLVEGAVVRVHGMPSKVVYPLEGPADALADATSAGYRAAVVLSYGNAIGAVRLSPRLQFQHDVNGNSPSPAGPFVEGRYAVTLGLGANYLDRWSADMSYTQFAGAGKRNRQIDRDFLTLSLKYSF